MREGRPAPRILPRLRHPRDSSSPRFTWLAARSRDNRLRSRYLVARWGSAGGKSRERSRRGDRGQERRGEEIEWRGRASGDNTHTHTYTHTLVLEWGLLHRSTEFRQRNRSRIQRSAASMARKREKKKEMQDEEDWNAKWSLFRIRIRNNTTQNVYIFFVTQFKRKSKCDGVYIPLQIGVKSIGTTFRFRATTIIRARKNQGRRQRRDYTSLISNYTIIFDQRDDSFNCEISSQILSSWIDKLLFLLRSNTSLEFASNITCHYTYEYIIYHCVINDILIIIVNQESSRSLLHLSCGTAIIIIRGGEEEGERGANALGYLFLVTSPPTGGVPGCAWNDGSYTFLNAHTPASVTCTHTRCSRKFLDRCWINFTR